MEGDFMTQAQRDINRKLRILNYAKENGNVAKTCRYFGISREIFYRWKRSYESLGEEALINNKPCPQNLKLRTPKEIEEKIIYLRKTYHLGPERISWFLKRYTRLYCRFMLLAHRHNICPPFLGL
jgi:transposase